MSEASNCFDRRQLIDSHCHLNMLSEQGHEIAEALNTARDHHNVGGVLNISVDLESAPQIIETAERYPNVWASVGVHPCYPESKQPTEMALLELANSSAKVVAIGETGLDFFRASESGSAWQYERFKTQLSAAKTAKLPIIIHSRQAATQTIKLLKANGAQDCGGVMHCFVEDWVCAKAALDLGFFISFSGILTFKNATDLQEVAKKVPLDRILVETDAPYLAPVPFRGKVNQPGYVAYVAQCLADLKGISIEALTQQTASNFFTCFPKAQG